MKTFRYESPEMEITNIAIEGLLCVSGSDPMELPDVTWKDETEW